MVGPSAAAGVRHQRAARRGLEVRPRRRPGVPPARGAQADHSVTRVRQGGVRVAVGQPRGATPPPPATHSSPAPPPPCVAAASDCMADGAPLRSDAHDAVFGLKLRRQVAQQGGDRRPPPGVGAPAGGATVRGVACERGGGRPTERPLPRPGARSPPHTRRPQPRDRPTAASLHRRHQRPPSAHALVSPPPLR